MVAAVATLLASVVLARRLPPREFGAFVTVATAVLLGAAVCRFGLHGAAVRFVSEAVEFDGRDAASIRAREIAKLAVGASIIGAVVAGAVVLPPVLPRITGSEAAGWLVWLVALLMAAEGWRFVLAETFRGFHRIGTSVVLGNAARSTLFVVVLFVVGSVARVHDLSGALVLFMVSSVVVATVAALALWRSTTTPAPAEPPVAARRNWRDFVRMGGPLVVVELTTMAVEQGDVVVVGVLRHGEDAAAYGSAVRLVSVLAWPLLAVAMVMGPIVAALHARGEIRRLERAVRAATTVGFATVLMGFVVLELFGRPLLRIVYGEFYVRGHEIVAILSIGPLVTAFTGICGIVLIMAGEERKVMVASVVLAVVSIGGQVLVGSAFGPRGIAAISAAGTVVQGFVMLALARVLVGVNTLPSTQLRPLLRALRR